MSKLKVGLKRKPPIVLSGREIEDLMAAPNVRCRTGLRNRAMLAAMHGAGLRVSEVVRLGVHDLDWSHGTLKIRNRRGGRDRNVPVSAETLAWLRAWAEKRPRQAEAFFCTLAGGKVSARYVWGMVKRLAARAGLKRANDVSPRVLRHTHATDLLDGGFTLPEVQQLLGHAQLSTTRVYLHARPASLAARIQGPDRKAAEELGRRITAMSDEDAKKLLMEILSMVKVG